MKRNLLKKYFESKKEKNGNLENNGVLKDSEGNVSQKEFIPGEKNLISENNDVLKDSEGNVYKRDILCVGGNFKVFLKNEKTDKNGKHFYIKKINGQKYVLSYEEFKQDKKNNSIKYKKIKENDLLEDEKGLFYKKCEEKYGNQGLFLFLKMMEKIIKSMMVLYCQ